MSVQATIYGSLPVAAAAEDVSALWTYSVDLRRETGGSTNAPDESRWYEPGTFTRPVFPTLPGHHPVGEVRIMLDGQDVRLVGARTSRDGVVEVTAEEVRAMRKNETFAQAMRAWLRD